MIDKIEIIEDKFLDSQLSSVILPVNVSLTESMLNINELFYRYYAKFRLLDLTSLGPL